jgi:Fur family ferric uptake transcriptional regulator
MPHCQSYLHTLRDLGYRITPQRELIIEALAHSGQHVTADEIYTQVHGRSRAINVATVYRTLDLLVENGLACRVGLEDGCVVYAAVDHGSHIHLTCRSCGMVIDAEPTMLTPLADQLQREHDFTADLQHLSLIGLCKNCRSKRPT